MLAADLGSHNRARAKQKDIFTIFGGMEQLSYWNVPDQKS